MRFIYFSQIEMWYQLGLLALVRQVSASLFYYLLRLFKFIWFFPQIGVAGSLTYAFLLHIGLTPKATMLLMLAVPLMQLATFCTILREPNNLFTLSRASSTTSLLDHSIIDQDVFISQAPLNFKQKIQFFPKMLKYVFPLFFVYLGEYFINQGLVCVYSKRLSHAWLRGLVFCPINRFYCNLVLSVQVIFNFV